MNNNHNQTPNDYANKLMAVFRHVKSLYPQLDLIEISYDGCGDSGQVQRASFYDPGHRLTLPRPNGLERTEIDVDDTQLLPTAIYCERDRQWDTTSHQMVDLGPTKCTIGQALDSLGWDLPYSLDPGFEINDGAYGEISVRQQPEDDGYSVSIEVNHNERFTDVTSHLYTF